MRIRPADFEFLRALLLAQAGIVLEPGKEYLVDSRLQPIVRSEGLDTLASLMAKLRAPRSGELSRRVVAAMATHETMFFRDIAPFEALRKFVLPGLMDARQKIRRLTIWYAGSSTGQEPYSVSMLIREHLPELLSWDLRQLATDISPSVLARAREGRYSRAELDRGLPAEYLQKYFRQQGHDWQIAESVRRMVQFEELNLMHPWPNIGPVDLLLLRNVMIYFDVETKKQMLRRIRRVLSPDGYLFLGNAETTMNLDDAFGRQQYKQAGYYRPRTEAAIGAGQR